MSSLWRRNLLAFAVLGLIAVPAGWLAVQHERSQYSSFSGDHPVDGHEREATRFGGMAFGPVSTVTVDNENAPPHTEVLQVTVAVDPGVFTANCGTPTLHEVGGQNRQWIADRDNLLDLPYDENRMVACDSATSPFEMTLHYIVPADAKGPFTLNVVVDRALPNYLRLPFTL